MWLSPAEPVSGTALRFAIPESMSEPNYSESAKTKELVLLVDDDRVVRELVRVMLTREGYQVLTAKDIEEAESHMRVCSPDVVIADFQLGNASGLDLLRAVRSRSREVKLLLISGSTKGNIDAIARTAGANGGLAKPFRADELKDTIKRLLTTG
jgi:DNA-binding response OmpR family regulator